MQRPAERDDRKPPLTRGNVSPPRSLHHIGYFAKVRVASSNLVARSSKGPGHRAFFRTEPAAPLTETSFPLPFRSCRS
jgi:hypothetical protein